ncbi:hypothetical protein [Demequina subtropica]|uniref:hypothetical protein n=1 Tax=Demequina subtropica TaxID=1638989 RepID=UPI000784DB83|nr:hypothetical protein [Demequina subtropica]
MRPTPPSRAWTMRVLAVAGAVVGVSLVAAPAEASHEAPPAGCESIQEAIPEPDRARTGISTHALVEGAGGAALASTVLLSRRRERRLNALVRSRHAGSRTRTG